MPKYKHKPTVIDAEQYFHGAECMGVETDDEGNYPHIVTVYGQKKYITKGDWIVRETDGIHFYRVSPAVFEATYEALETGEQDD